MADTTTGVENLPKTDRAWKAFEEPGVAGRKLAVPLAVLLNLCVTLTFAARLNVWLDEAYTLHTTGRGLRFAFSQALRFELQPPLYFVLLSLWRTFSDSVLWGRLFSVACVALAVYVAALVARRYVKEANPNWFVVAFALHPFVIWAASEMRVYALLILLSALLLLLFHEGYLADAARREVAATRARWAYIAVAVIVLYTQYYAGYLLAALGLALVVLERRAALRAYFWSMVIVGICFAPMLSVLFYQVPAHTKEAAQASFVEDVARVGGRVIWFVFPADWARPLFNQIIASPAAITTALALAVVGATLAALALYFKKRRRQFRRPAAAPEAIALWVVCAAVFACFVLTALLTTNLSVATRHMAVLFLPLTLAIFSAVARRIGNAGAALWAAATLLIGLISVGALGARMSKPGDWRRVAAHIAAAERPGQSILVFPADNVLPLAHHYQGPNVVVALPAEPRLITYDLSQNKLNSEQDVVAALRRMPDPKDQMWLVTDDLCGWLGVDFNCGILENFIDENYSVESSENFFGSKVRLLRLKSAPGPTPSNIEARKDIH